MMRKKHQTFGLVFAVLLVMLVAGCVEGGGSFWSIFGQKGQVREAPNDIITIQNENIVPQPPEIAGDEFSVTFEVKNVDDLNSVQDVTVQLFDWGLCSEEKMDTTWNKTDSSFTKDLRRMAPGQSKPVEIMLKAPTATQLANLPGRCPVKYKVNYTFTAATSTSAEVISATRLRELQTAMEIPQFTPITDIGRGPIKIYMEPVSSMPARTGSALTLAVQVQNKGTGTYSKVPEHALMLKIPNTWNLTDGCGGEFELAESNDYNFYNNIQDIFLVGRDKQTYEIRCSFLMPSESEVRETKDYSLFANLTYAYDLIRDLDIEVNP